MTSASPADTKLVISAYHRFTLWRSPPEMAERVRQRWPEMRVVDLPHYDRLAAELPDTDIFVGFLLRPEQLRQAATPEVGALDRRRRRATDVSRVARLRDHSHQRQRRACSGDGRAHRRDAGRDGAGFPRRRCASRRSENGRSRRSGTAVRGPRELSGAVALLVGFGAVGRAVAERLRAFGMRIWAVTRSGKADADRSRSACFRRPSLKPRSRKRTT